MPDNLVGSDRLREALERIVLMCDVPPTCTCGRPNGLPAVVACARAALASSPSPPRSLFADPGAFHQGPSVPPSAAPPADHVMQSQVSVGEDSNVETEDGGQAAGSQTQQGTAAAQSRGGEAVPEMRAQGGDGTLASGVRDLMAGVPVLQARGDSETLSAAPPADPVPRAWVYRERTTRGGWSRWYVTDIEPAEYGYADRSNERYEREIHELGLRASVPPVQSDADRLLERAWKDVAELRATGFVGGSHAQGVADRIAKLIAIVRAGVQPDAPTAAPLDTEWPIVECPSCHAAIDLSEIDAEDATGDQECPACGWQWTVRLVFRIDAAPPAAPAFTPPYEGWRPYCLACPTMLRMEPRPYGWQCAACKNRIARDLRGVELAAPPAESVQQEPRNYIVAERDSGGQWYAVGDLNGPGALFCSEDRAEEIAEEIRDREQDWKAAIVVCLDWLAGVPTVPAPVTESET